MNDFDPLMMFVVESEKLICARCDTVICDIEDGDLLAQLANSADEHWRESHPGVT